MAIVLKTATLIGKVSVTKCHKRPIFDGKYTYVEISEESIEKYK